MTSRRRPFDGRSYAPVVVLASATTGHGVARSLGRLGVRAYGLYPSQAEVARSRFWHKVKVLDVTRPPETTRVANLARFGASLAGRPHLIATTDDQARFIAIHSALLQDTFLFPDVHHSLVDQLADKRRLYALCRSLDVPTPISYFPENAADLRATAESLTFPLIAKETETRASIWHMKVIVHSPDDLARLLALMPPKAYEGFMLQEYLPAQPDSRWLFNGYFDASGRCLFGSTAVKHRENPISGGIAALAECRENARLVSEASNFLSRIGYSGPVDIDYCYDDVADKYLVLDVNPRVGASFRALVDDRGWDVARAMFADLEGIAVKPGRPLNRRRWLAEHADLVSSLRAARAGRLNFRTWISSLVDVKELAWFALDDLRPLLDLARLGLIRLHRTVRHGGRNGG